MSQRPWKPFSSTTKPPQTSISNPRFFHWLQRPETNCLLGKWEFECFYGEVTQRSVTHRSNFSLECHIRPLSASCVESICVSETWQDGHLFFFFNENGSNSYPGLCNSLISFAYLYVLDISSVQSLTLTVARYSKGLQLEISFFIIKQEWTDGFWNRVCKTGPLKDMSRLEQLTVVSFPEPWGLWALALAFRGSWGKVPGPLWRA